MQNGRPKMDLTPVANLPTHIKPEPGRISLIADFDHKAGGDVDIYLINNTETDVYLASQDGDLGCKREAKTESSRWMRCDSHGFSWCGNSYGSRPLKAGQFLAWTQAVDTKTGQARPLRFKLYGQSGVEIVSNEGVGVVDDADLEFCRYDSMAMQHGPFEDVAAVATGKVHGGQGASIDARGDAIRGLERFPTDKRLFSVVKEMIERVKASVKSESDRRGDTYTQCLAPLRLASGPSLSRDEVWDYVNGHLHDTSFPWRSNALEWMLRTFEWEKDKLKPVIEEVLSAKGHPAFGPAAFAYAKVVEKHEAGAKLAAIESDKERSEADRQLAKQARETLFPNPYLSIKAESGEPLGNDGDVAPLKKVTISNIAPQTITLPVAKAEALLVIEISEASDNALLNSRQYFIDNEKGSLSIEPGKGVVIQDVKWWEVLRGQPIKPDSYYNVRFLARTPTLWSVPTQPNWGWAPKGEKILKALEISKDSPK